jgi:hypothetical protein
METAPGKGNLSRRRDRMATKKARKRSKPLKKAKKLSETKPLSWQWGVK